MSFDVKQAWAQILTPLCTHGVISGLSLCLSEPRFLQSNGANEADLIGHCEDIIGEARSPVWRIAGR